MKYIRRYVLCHFVFLCLEDTDSNIKPTISPSTTVKVYDAPYILLLSQEPARKDVTAPINNTKSTANIFLHFQDCELHFSKTILTGKFYCTIVPTPSNLVINTDCNFHCKHLTNCCCVLKTAGFDAFYESGINSKVFVGPTNEGIKILIY